MKTIRFILALVVLLGPASGLTRAQVAPGVTVPGPAPVTPTTRPTTNAPVLPPSGVSPLPASGEDVLPTPEEQKPAFFNQGVLVEKLSGETVRETAADQAFNPASAVKLVTALAALKTFGAKHRFATTFWITGSFDKATGTVNGDLVVSGQDPSFHDEHAVAVARELNQLGVRVVTGDLV
ncbi:MAG TPA: D-alanyl-D-alanine carboxypeptidase, partial [Pyrinomonadaceae bacterium]|nr:D-alanyl-D-alanine carboxypeptidase [Pyrinomonadaceae bacterium]